MNWCSWLSLPLRDRLLLKTVLKRQEIIMAKIDELGLAVNELNATTELVLKKLEGTSLDPQLDAATTAINDAVGKLKAAIA